MKVLFIESNNSEDFFEACLDGVLAHHLTKILRIESKLLYALDVSHFEKAIDIAKDDGFNVFHLSCHGDKESVSLCSGPSIPWSFFTAMFERKCYEPEVLVMSSCCGATNGLSEAFKRQTMRPKIIFGSRDARHYNEYAVAWTILYNHFQSEDVSRDVAQKALREINAMVHRNFRHLRWDDKKKRYLNYPSKKTRYRVKEHKNK